MGLITFTKKLNNEVFFFENHSDKEGQFFKVTCNKLGRPFIMIKGKSGNWVIRPGETVEPEIRELEAELSNTIKTNNR